MEINPDLTLREVQARLDKAGCKLHMTFDHGVYNVYAISKEKTLRGYCRGDFAEAIDTATKI